MLLVVSEMHFKQNSSFGWPGLNHDTVGAIDSIQANQMKNFPLKYLLDHFWKPLAKKDRPDSFCVKSYKLKNISISAPDSNMATFGEPNSNLTSKPAKPTI